MAAEKPDSRPDPDALLANLEREQRGRLKIFLGAAPGVGKTWEMLSAANHKREAGLDVEVGTATNGAATIPAVIAGGVDVGYANLFSQAQAHIKGLPIALLFPVDVRRWPSGDGTRRPARFTDSFRTRSGR